jgi:hypothetical protein
MTHPHHDPAKSSSGKRRVKNGEPFDPEELTRRLTAYVTEQKLASQRRRESRAARERAAAIAAGVDPNTLPDGYHHVPAVAASAFQRTATPITATTETVHKLSAPILRASLSPNNIDDPSDHHYTSPNRQTSTKRPTTSLQQTVLQDQAEIGKERIRNRNQFQLTQALESAAEVDELRDVYRLPVRTFGEFAHLRNAHSKAHSRPLSTSDVFSDPEEADIAPPSTSRLTSPRPKPTFEGRNDWAQEDDVGAKGTQSPVEKGSGNPRTLKKRGSGMGPFLRRKESVWVLMGKKEKDKERKADDAPRFGIADNTSPPPLDAKKGPGFLARFKRTSS